MIAPGSYFTWVYENRPGSFGVLPLPEGYMKQVVPMLAKAGAKTIQTVYEGGPGKQCEPSSLEHLARATNMIIQGEHEMMEAPKKEDFLPIARNMSLPENNPDVVITCTYDAACKEWIAALREVDWSPKAQVFSICVGLETFSEDVGTDAEYLVGMSPWDKTLSVKDGISGWTPEEFVELYEAYSGRDAAYHAALGQATVSLMAQAIEFSNSTAYEDVANALQTQAFETVFGTVSFDENGQNKMDLIATQYDSNRTVNVVYPTDLAGAELVYPMPTWAKRDCMKLSPCNAGSAYAGVCKTDGTCECTSDNEVSFGKGPTAACHAIPEEDMTYIKPSLKIVGYLFVALQSVASIFFTGWSIYYNNRIVVRLSQPVFLVLVAFGCFIMGLSIVPLAEEGDYRYEQDPQTREETDNPADGVKELDAACMAFPWLLAIGFSITFSALFAKIVRVRKIMANAEAFRRRKVRVYDVMFVMVVIMAIEFVILLAWQFTAPLKWQREVVATSDLGYPTQSVGQCGAEKSKASLAFSVVLFVANFACILIALVLCYITREVKSELNEAKWITASIISILQVLVLVIPITIIASENTSAAFFVKSAAIFITSMAVTIFIFVPKFINLHFNENSDSINVSALFARSSKSREKRASKAAGTSRLSLSRSSFTDFVFELIKFKMTEGHCRVPVKNGGVLGKWVGKIQREFKKLKPIKRSLPENGDLKETSPEPVDITLDGVGVYFANAEGRGDGVAVVKKEPKKSKDSDGVPENLQLDLYLGPSDLMESSKSIQAKANNPTTIRFDRIKTLASLGFVWEFPSADYVPGMDTSISDIRSGLSTLSFSEMRSGELQTASENDLSAPLTVSDINDKSSEFKQESEHEILFEYPEKS
jgi:hypothetical protein